MRKIAKLLFSISLLLCFVLAAPEAFAEETDFAGKSLDEVVVEFLAEYNATEGQATIGYYNTVTGEEYYYGPDQYMVSGSMYKVPLTMIYAEKIQAGEIKLEDYELLLTGTIVNSNNDYAATLWNRLGTYNQYRRIIAPLMGEDPDTVDSKFYENNFFTARQVIACLKQLYEDQETYGYILDLMKRAEPKEYFRRYEDRYEVAHKYGYLLNEDWNITYLNDCGIIYTGDPYLLVCFTAGAQRAYELVGNLVTLMSDYTQYQHDTRVAAEEEQRRLEAEEKLKEAREQGIIPTPEVEPAEEPAVEPQQTGNPIVRAIALAVLSGFCAGLVVYAEIKSRSLNWKRLIIGILCIFICLFFSFVAISGSL